MEPVLSYEAYSALLADHKARWGRLNHNNYHLEDDLQGLISQGKLFYQVQGDVLVLAVREADWDDLIYYLPAQPQTEFDLSRLSRPTLLTTVFTHETPKLLQAEAYWQARGFSLYKASRYMAVETASIPEPTLEIRPAETRAHAEQFAKLIREHFYPYGDGVPTADEIMEDIRQGLVLGCTLPPEGDFAGFIRAAAPVGNRLDHLHIATDPAFRGRGCARNIIQGWAAWCRRRDIATMTLWVNRGNTAAEHLYESMGYRYTGKESRQFLYEPAAMK